MTTAAEQFALRRQSPLQRVQHTLHAHPAITDEPRRRLADRGIAALARATELKPTDAEAFSYWNLLLRGMELPIEAEMSMAGKRVR